MEYYDDSMYLDCMGCWDFKTLAYKFHKQLDVFGTNITTSLGDYIKSGLEYVEAYNFECEKQNCKIDAYSFIKNYLSMKKIDSLFTKL